MRPRAPLRFTLRGAPDSAFHPTVKHSYRVGLATMGVRCLGVLGVGVLLEASASAQQQVPAQEESLARQAAPVIEPELALGARVAATETPSSTESEVPVADVPAPAVWPEQAAVYCQILGTGVMIGIGVSYRPIDAVAVDAGIGLFAIPARPSLAGVNPAVGVSWLSGGPHNFELGATASAMIVDDASDRFRPFWGPHVGYRYQPSGGKLFLRALVHGVVLLSREVIVPWPGIGLGATWDR